jgi:hypothetical protein
MGFLKRLASFFLEGAEGGEDKNAHWEYVRCSRCGEKLPVRVDLRNELTPQYEGGEGAFYVRKGTVGSGKNRCFQSIEVELFFDSSRRRVSRYITGGEFITKEEFDAQEGG